MDEPLENYLDLGKNEPVEEKISMDTLSSDPKSFEGVLVAKNDISKEIEILIDTINSYSRKREFIMGFTVQVYTGRNREEAFKAKEIIYEITEEYDPEVSYIQPNFKVKIGKFLERIEARRLKESLKDDFPNAIVIPERLYFENK
jgi:hypothetical protein